MTPARSLELFFIDGRPDGMLTASVFNWTGHVLRVPRTQLKDGLARKESGFTGVYALLGDRDGAPLAYVGEAEDMGARLRQHAAQKDWWDTAILITTSADNLHKAHVRYLEARLIDIAKDVAATDLENGNHPNGASLSEADRANMESFLSTLMMVLPAIRIDIFLTKKRAPDLTIDAKVAGGKLSLPTPTSPITFFQCTRARDGLHARAAFQNGELFVLKGSQAANWSGQRHSGYTKLHEDLNRSGIIVDGIFTADYAFSSPSAAAAVVLGRPANGRTKWRVQGCDQTYADWETAQLAEATS